jgi:hypothetical protein
VEYENPQRFACQAGSLIEKLPQTSANQRLLAERGYDRLLQRIVFAPIADVFDCVSTTAALPACNDQWHRGEHELGDLGRMFTTRG